MNLIIIAPLSEPPTESLYFRYLTLISKTDLNLSCLIEADQCMKDLYYYYLRRQGSLDYIEQFITPEEREFGIRLDSELNYPLTIRTKYIGIQNFNNIIGQIKYLTHLR